MDFTKALPIWAKGLEREKNITCGLFSKFEHREEKVLLRVTGSSLYRAFLNGRLVAYGPARAPHRFFRIDEWDLTSLAADGSNALYIETAGYNINTFYTLDQRSFIQAELLLDDTVAAATGFDGFTARIVTERVQKTPKYSFQRPFTEAWRLTPAYPASYFDEAEDTVKLAVQDDVRYLTRNVLYPEFTEVFPFGITASGEATNGHKREKYRRDRAVKNVSPIMKGYRLDELEVNLNDLAQEFDYLPDEKPAPFAGEFHLEANHYAVYGFEKIDAGFPAFTVRCEKDMTLWMIWDEMLTNGDADFNRHSECVNAMCLELKPGCYRFTGFEAYVFMAMKFIALGGGCTLSNVRLIEYAAPLPNFKPCPVNDPEVRAIYDAAVNCYRLCCLESFMDDPSRERNDCLFDSYFMAHAEKLLTGSCAVEHNMMEAYCLADEKDFFPLSDGQLPTMYPGDHYDHFYACTHQMWLAIQFDEYVGRSGDRAMAEAFRPRLYKSREYFQTFKNADGLLENLKGWIFLDWEEANNAAGSCSVSYSGNMIYAGMLDALYNLYGEESFAEEAAQIREAVREQSYFDGVFHDTAIRGEDGKLVVTDVVTQSCQTYAFFFGFANPEKDHALLDRLVTCAPGMSPQHALTQPIRLSMVQKYLGTETFLTELKRVYGEQVRQTGSMWEDDTPLRNLVEAIHAEIVLLISEIG